MAFITFIGRVLFASVFILSAWQDCRIAAFKLTDCWLMNFPNGTSVRGGLSMFNGFGTDGGAAAKSLEPKFHIFSKHVLSHTGVKFPEVEIKLLVAAAIALKGVGGILFVFGSSLGAFLLLLHQAISIPILYDFYNYDVEKKEFNQLFLKFTQSLALFGALLFFIGMKNSTPRRQLRKKAPKTKTG